MSGSPIFLKSMSLSFSLSVLLSVCRSMGYAALLLGSAVILRGLVRTERLVRLRVGVPDSPGCDAALGWDRAFDDALAQGCDTLVTIGGVQSNHTRQVAAVAARIGMKCHLVQESWVTWPDAVYDRVGNILISHFTNGTLDSEAIVLRDIKSWANFDIEFVNLDNFCLER